MQKRFFLSLALFAIILGGIGSISAQKTGQKRKQPNQTQAMKNGDAVEVEWEGDWYPAIILERDGKKSYIKYDGYGDEWNEWVGPERIRKPIAARYKTGMEVEAESGGVWYYAIILKVSRGKYFIHYIGYGNEEDEWIARERIRPIQ